MRIGLHAKGRDRDGAFTLIEVLASMAVLAILVLALVRIFGQATKSFERATTATTRNATARAVMDLLARDLEGMVVDGRIACYKEAETFDADFDRICFVTMSSGPPVSEGQRAYQFVQYYVTTNSNARETGYKTFQLMRQTVNLIGALGFGIDPFRVATIPALATNKWWKHPSLGTAGMEELVAENIVRFDIWICDENSHHIAGGDGQGFFANLGAYYDSTESVNLGDTPPPDPDSDQYPSNRPPAYIDIYLQIASDDAMKKASALLEGWRASGDGSLSNQAYRTMYQDSDVLVQRVVPSMRQAEIMHPLPY